ncbi:MAG: M56 family metallopeptidase [Planctomycetota bacterium]|jgi:beta-lactamase regulating signal transducer with metallopeptidase domain
METIANIFQAEIIQRLGWILVHFVWQAGAIGLALAIVLKLLHKSSANLRYIIACMALGLIVLMPAVTIRMIGVSVETIEPVKEVAVDLPEVSVDTRAVIEMPQAESLPQVQVAVALPKVSLKDKFVESVEPALPYLVIGWLVGVFGLSLWYLGGWTQLQRLRRQMVKEVTPGLKAKLQQLSNMLGIRETVGLVESALVQVPTVVGHLKPVILLPASALTGLSTEQIEAILAHELAHIKRHDYLVNMLQTVVEILGFYHPAVWWVSHKIRVERENCCDDIAVSLCSDKVCYAKALTTMEEIRAGQPALAVAASGGSLFERIGRLLERDTQRKIPSNWAVAFCVLIACICVIAGISQTGFSSQDSSNTKPSLTDIRKMVEKNEALTSLFKLDCTVTPVREERPSDSISNGISRRASATRRRGRSYGYSKFIWAQDGIKQHSTVTRFYGPNEPGRTSIHIIDGKMSKTLYKADLADGAIDEIDKFDWNYIPPAKLGLRLFEGIYKLSDILVPEYTEVAEKTEKKNGREAYVVIAKRPGDRPYFGKIWIDSERGVPLHMEYYDGHPGFDQPDVVHDSYEQPSESAKTKMISDIKSIKLHQLPNGGWMPVKGIRTIYFRDGWAPEDHIAVDVESITIRREDIPDSLFTLEFAEGAKVYNGFLVTKLETLGKVLLKYAAEHDDKFPDGLEQIKVFDTEGILPWAVENVTYLGKGISASQRPSQKTVAYDRVLMEKTGYTNVLLRNGRALFIGPENKRFQILQENEPDVQVEGEGENNVQAPSLKDFERKLIGQVLDLVKKVENEYPEEATHWPSGPGLYHVDGQGEVTVWNYQRLWHKSKDCAEDEVGWGSSQLVNAEGMYYLPDGKPLQSRWSERGDGMKDIRVKVGRTVGEKERVAVIHRHRLSSNRDLLSRDKLKKHILLESWKNLPLAIIVRVDRPMRLAGWWLGDIKTDIQRFDEYDQLIVNSPPGNNDRPMIITVALPVRNVQVEVGEVGEPGDFRKEGWKIFMGGHLEERIKDKEKMDPESLITVRTVDHKGNPIPYCRVTFVDRDEKTTHDSHEAATDDKGYTYCDKIGGTFSITAAAFGYVPETKVYRYQLKKMAKLYNAQDKSVITIRWDPFPTGKGKIKGKVRDQHGKTLKKFELQIKQQKGRSDDWSESYTTIECIKVEDPQGYFELTGLAPGKYTYRVRAEDYSAYVWDFDMGQFTITEEPDALVQLDIEVEAKELLYGRAVYEDGTPVYPGTFALWFEIYPPRSAEFGRHFGGWIEPDGLFRAALSREEHKDFMKTSQGYVNIKNGDGVEVGKVHIDKLSKNPDNAPTFTFSRKMRKESLENKPGMQVEGGKRALHFPNTLSVGTLYVRDTRPGNWYEGWEKIGEAKGEISVSAGKQAKLVISESAAGDLSFLSELGADDIQMLSFGYNKVNIGSLAPIGSLKKLKALNLQSTSFNSEDLSYIAGLEELEVLRLGDHKLRDESMQYVGELPKLQWLSLWGTGISDEGLKHLQNSRNLTFLALNNCDITNEGLSYLNNMTKLEGLQLTQTKISDRGLAKLKRLHHLKDILIMDNGITDAGLEHLKDLTSLEVLWINWNPVTDDGLF